MKRRITALMLGMLMIPKTVCYMLMIVSFLRYSKENN